MAPGNCDVQDTEASQRRTRRRSTSAEVLASLPRGSRNGLFFHRVERLDVGRVDHDESRLEGYQPFQCRAFTVGREPFSIWR